MVDRSKFETFEDLFNLTSNDNNIDKANIIEIDLGKLHPYPNHYFHRPEGEEWESFVESIKRQGVLQPIIVRKHPEMDDEYQIIAGHCRTQGAREAGFEKIPAMVIEVDDDVEVSVLVGVTNKQRSYVSDVEWGRTFRVTYEQMKKQGARVDLTSSHDETKLNGKRADEIIAEKYGESRATIQRKIRLGFLSDKLAEIYINKQINQAVAIQLSYLDDKLQNKISDFLQANNFDINEEQAHRLKEKGDNLTDIDIIEIFENKEKDVKKYKPTFKISKRARKKFFTPDFTEDEIDKVIEHLLEEWAKENNPDYMQDSE